MVSLMATIDGMAFSTMPDTSVTADTAVAPWFADACALAGAACAIWF